MYCTCRPYDNGAEAMAASHTTATDQSTWPPRASSVPSNGQYSKFSILDFPKNIKYVYKIRGCAFHWEHSTRRQASRQRSTSTNDCSHFTVHGVDVVDHIDDICSGDALPNADPIMYRLASPRLASLRPRPRTIHRRHRLHRPLAWRGRSSKNRTWMGRK